MFSRKNIAAVLAAAGLAAAGTVIAAEGAKEQGCAGGNQASGERHGQGHGMERMQERHARMAAHMSARHGGEAKQGQEKPKEEEHKH